MVQNDKGGRMLISCGEHVIRINAWLTKRELAYVLSGCTAGSILLGDDADEARQFHTAVVYLKWPKTSEDIFGVGICSEGPDLTPQLLSISNLLMFGFNREVV